MVAQPLDLIDGMGNVQQGGATAEHFRHALFALFSELIVTDSQNFIYTLKGGVPVGRAETKVVSQPVYVRLK